MHEGGGHHSDGGFSGGHDSGGSFGGSHHVSHGSGHHAGSHSVHHHGGHQPASYQGGYAPYDSRNPHQYPVRSVHSESANVASRVFFSVILVVFFIVAAFAVIFIGLVFQHVL
jgi:hypothetical protein